MSMKAYGACGGWIYGVNFNYYNPQNSIIASRGTYQGSAYGGSCEPTYPQPDNYCEWWWNPEFESWNCASPILLPVGRRGTRDDLFHLTGPNGGVNFDYNGDGILERTGWTHEDAAVAFLALDRNGNGTIDNGSELFGDFTLPGIHNGFDALREMAGGGGVIAAGHPLYTRLLLWLDKNHNGVSEPDELQPFSRHFTMIGLGAWVDGTMDRHGNWYALKGWAEQRTATGMNAATSPAEHRARLVDIYDVFFHLR